jgi:dihydrofolate reductase
VTGGPVVRVDMGTVTVVNHLTLDGVMQAPAGPDEDRRGGFDRGGWAFANADAVMGEELAGSASGGDGPSGLLLGRRTYEDLAAFWPTAPADDPNTARINAARKLVASRTLSGPLEWSGSELLEGDVVEAVRGLRASMDLTILGSGELIRSLIPHGLIDRYLLMMHPVVLGRGVRMFGEDSDVALELERSVTTTTGVIIATYRAVHD